LLQNKTKILGCGEDIFADIVSRDSFSQFHFAFKEFIVVNE